MDPRPDGVVSADEMVGVVGVETLHPETGSAYASVGPGTGMIIRDQAVTLGCVGVVCGLERDRVDLGFGPVDGAGRLEAADRFDQLAVEQPEAGWHGSARVEERPIRHDHRRAVGATHDDVIAPLRLATEEADDRVVVCLRRRAGCAGG